MKTQIVYATLLMSSLGAFAQVTQEDLNKEIKPLTEKAKTFEERFDNEVKPLNAKVLLIEEAINNDIKTLRIENSNLRSEIDILKNRLLNAQNNIDSLSWHTQDNSNAISQTANRLGIQISTTEETANQRIDEVGQSLSRTWLYGIIGVLSAILLSGLLYWLLSKRQETDKTDFIDQLSKTKSSIETSLLKEFGKQTELMDSQLHLIEQQRTTLQATPNAEPDHALALKLCSQINVMENNLNRMDQDVKGVKHIRRSIGTLKDNLSANGYEMPELLGKQFQQGMKVIVTSSIPDDNLEKGSEIISKILIPQVNYNDKMIQTAQLEVSVGY